MNTRQDELHDWVDGETYGLEAPIRVAAPNPTKARPRAIAGPARGHFTADSAPMTTPNPTASLDSKSTATPMPHKRHLLNFPGFIARSAMFRVTRNNDVLDQPTPINVAGGSMNITGPLLCMRDKAVWETAIQLAKERSSHVGDAFEIELRDFARRMGSNNLGGKALDSIWSSLARLAHVRVEFEIDKGRCKGVGSLLASAIKSGGRTRLRLNPDFAIPALIGDRQFRFDTRRRNALSSALAQWLHDYYTTHKLAEDLDLKYLRQLCGYDGAARNFPAKLRDAMDELLKAAPSLIASYSVVGTERSSDAWKLRVSFGSETPSFLAAGKLPSPPTAKGHGGVSL